MKNLAICNLRELKGLCENSWRRHLGTRVNDGNFVSLSGETIGLHNLPRVSVQNVPESNTKW